MRFGSCLLASALVSLAVTSEQPARASDPCQAAPLVSTCINADTLWPHAGPQRFVNVGGTETDDAGRFGFGLVTDYQSRPIILTVPSPGGAGSSQYAINDQVNGTFLWSYGFTRRLELDLAVPITFGQGGTGAEPITGSAQQLRDTAVRDLRFGVTYAIIPREPADQVRVWSLTARFETSAPTGDRTQFAGDRTAVFVPSLAADYRRGRWFAGIEIGARIRPDTQVLGANVGPQGFGAVGVGYDLLQKVDLLGVMVEAWTLPTFATQYQAQQTIFGTTETTSGKFLAPSEWMLSVRSSPVPTGDFTLTAGGGGPIPTGDDVTAPRFRFVLGLRYAPSEGDRDRDRDKVPDSRDKCPDDPGPAPSGCPEGMRAPVRLDLARVPDACKSEPDTVDGFRATDGCPDEDTDKDGIDDRLDKCPLDAEDFLGPSDGCPEGKAPAPKAP